MNILSFLFATRTAGRNAVLLLKRPFLRIVYPDGHYADFPIEEVIEAVIKYPELELSEALYLASRGARRRDRENFW